MLCEPHTFHQLHRTLRSLGAQRGAKLHGIFNVAANGHVFKQRIVLKHNAHLPAVGRVLRDILAVQKHSPLVRRKQSDQNAQKRCFAAAGGP